MNVLQELILFCGQIWWRFSHTVSDSLWHLSEPEGAFGGEQSNPGDLPPYQLTLIKGFQSMQLTDAWILLLYFASWIYEGCKRRKV